MGIIKKAANKLHIMKLKRLEKNLMQVDIINNIPQNRSDIDALIERFNEHDKTTASLLQTQIAHDRLYERVEQDELTIASLIRSQKMLDELLLDYKKTKLMLTSRTEKLADALFSVEENGKYPEVTDDFWDEEEFVMLNKRSYSQAGEDSIIAHIVAVLGIPFEECTYLDLGANQPKEMSNTYFYYSKGASGVLVEANPMLAARLGAVRSRDVVLNKCISSKSGEYLDFNIMNIDGLSMIGDVSEVLEKNPQAKVVQTINIETISVPDIIEKYFEKAPVIMNVDIEGMEMDVLNSIDFEICRPLIIITEMIPYSTTLTVNIKNREISDFMKKVGYEEFAFTGINSIFIDMRNEKLKDLK